MVGLELEPKREENGGCGCCGSGVEELENGGIIDGPDDGGP